MSSTASYANFESKEGTVNGEVTLTFNLKPRKIVITNDDSSGNLSFKFNTSEAFGTLLPTETVCLEVASKTLMLSGTSINYRIWAIG